MRLRLVELCNGDSFSLPLTPADIADACALTAEHVNRVLRQLQASRGRVS